MHLEHRNDRDRKGLDQVSLSKYLRRSHATSRAVSWIGWIDLIAFFVIDILYFRKIDTSCKNIDSAGHFEERQIWMLICSVVFFCPGHLGLHIWWFLRLFHNICNLEEMIIEPFDLWMPVYEFPRTHYKQFDCVRLPQACVWMRRRLSASAMDWNWFFEPCQVQSSEDR